MGRTVAMLTMIETLIWIPEVLYNSRALMDSSTGLMDDSIVVSQFKYTLFYKKPSTIKPKI